MRVKDRIKEFINKLFSIKFLVFVACFIVFLKLQTNYSFYAFMVSMVLLVGCREIQRAIAALNKVKTIVSEDEKDSEQK